MNNKPRNIYLEGKYSPFWSHVPGHNTVTYNTFGLNQQIVDRVLSLLLVIFRMAVSKKEWFPAAFGSWSVDLLLQKI